MEGLSEEKVIDEFDIFNVNLKAGSQLLDKCMFSMKTTVCFI